MVTALAAFGARLDGLLARELLLFGVTGAALIAGLRSVVRDRARKRRPADDEVAVESVGRPARDRSLHSSDMAREGR